MTSLVARKDIVILYSDMLTYEKNLSSKNTNEVGL